MSDAETPVPAVCQRCHGEGYVCESCESNEAECICEDLLWEDDDELPDLMRCVCNPRPRANKAGP